MGIRHFDTLEKRKRSRRMGRNYLFFLIGLVVLLVFSFAFC